MSAAAAMTIAACPAAAASARESAQAQPATLADAVTFPADKSLPQSITLAGRKLNYIATVGTIRLRRSDGTVTGEVVFVAYTRPRSHLAERPVTFSFNGGPGAAQLALNLGAIGPKRVDTGTQGAGASDPAIAQDNPDTWLGFTDLVFIDPIGTGYSRSLLDEAATKKAFLTADADIHYLSNVIYEWLRANGRMVSPKYLVGESYGGYRVARIAEYLQNDMSIGVAGITMISPALVSSMRDRGTLISPIREMVALPSAAATNYETRGQALSAELMAPVETYARTQFLADLLAGPGDRAASDRMTAAVATFTGLDPADVRRRNGFISDAFVRLFHRGKSRIGSSYDATVTIADPFPESEQANNDDPTLSAEAPREQAMVDFIDRQVGWKLAARYIANNYDLNAAFDLGDAKDAAIADLRKAMANDAKMKVLVAHGWTDFACPYFVSKLVIAQMPEALASHVWLKMYPGGHLFYDRPASSASFRQDAARMYQGR